TRGRPSISVTGAMAAFFCPKDADVRAATRRMVLSISKSPFSAERRQASTLGLLAPAAAGGGGGGPVLFAVDGAEFDGVDLVPAGDFGGIEIEFDGLESDSRWEADLAGGGEVSRGAL
ncbi:hypothetical protein N9881_00930, partial [bacterium]|nr:hypothetical protein [bacterium]